MTDEKEPNAPAADSREAPSGSTESSQNVKVDEALQEALNGEPGGVSQEASRDDTAPTSENGTAAQPEARPNEGASWSDPDGEAEMLAMLEELPPDETAAAPDDVDTDRPAVGKAEFQRLSEPTSGVEPRNIALLMDVNLPVSIELGRTRMAISDILNLGPGSVVELDKLAGEPVDVLVNQKIVARGEVVVIDENFGVRVTQLISPDERLRMLGEE